MDTLTLGGFIAASGLVGLLLGWLANTLLGRRALARSQREADEITRQAKTDAEHREKEAELAVREERQRARRRSDKEIRERKADAYWRDHADRHRPSGSASSTSERLIDRSVLAPDPSSTRIEAARCQLRFKARFRCGRYSGAWVRRSRGSWPIGLARGWSERRRTSPTR